MRDHTQLRAFELADEVVMLVYRTTAGFPKEELFGLTGRPPDFDTDLRESFRHTCPLDGAGQCQETEDPKGRERMDS
jgi:hypothetical protein